MQKGKQMLKMKSIIVAMLIFILSITPTHSENWSRTDFVAMMRIQELGYAFLTTAVGVGITDVHAQSRLQYTLGYCATAASVAAVIYTFEKLLNKTCTKYYS